MNHLAESAAVVIVAFVAAYVALEYLRAFKRRNDLMDLFQAFQRETTELLQAQRMAGIETEAAITGLQNRFDNLLSSHETLVTRVGRFEDESKQAMSDLAKKWLGEMQEMNTRQAAAFTRTPNALSPRSFKP